MLIRPDIIPGIIPGIIPDEARSGGKPRFRVPEGRVRGESRALIGSGLKILERITQEDGSLGIPNGWELLERKKK